MGDWKMVDSMIVDGLWDVYNQYHMGITAENVAKAHGITRDMQDALALASQQKAAAAQDAGKLQGRDRARSAFHRRKGDPIVFAADEFINRKTNAEALAGLRPAFDKAGCGDRGQCLGHQRRCRRRDGDDGQEGGRSGPDAAGPHRQLCHQRAGPGHDGHGPGARLAEGAGSAPAGTPHDLDLLEINEAFAAQACAVNQEMGWDTCQGQCQRRRHCHRPSRSARRAAAFLVTLLHEMQTPRRQEGHCQPVHRRRHGRCA
jgi:acetyl-CoA C-acetyltransferase